SPVSRSRPSVETPRTVRASGSGSGASWVISARTSAPLLAAETLAKLSMSGPSHAVQGEVAGRRRRAGIEARDDFEGLTHEACERRMLGDEAREKVGEGRAFLFGPLRGQDFDHVGDEPGQRLDLALERLAGDEESVLRVIHLVDGRGEGGESLADFGEAGVAGIARSGGGHDDEPPVGKG